MFPPLLSSHLIAVVPIFIGVAPGRYEAFALDPSSSQRLMCRRTILPPPTSASEVCGFRYAAALRLASGSRWRSPARLTPSPLAGVYDCPVLNALCPFGVFEVKNWHFVLCVVSLFVCIFYFIFYGLLFALFFDAAVVFLRGRVCHLCLYATLVF